MTNDLVGARLTAQELIPGAYEQRPVTLRQSGSMGGPAFGSPGTSPISAATQADREREGGGAVSQRQTRGSRR